MHRSNLALPRFAYLLVLIAGVAMADTPVEPSPEVLPPRMRLRQADEQRMHGDCAGASAAYAELRQDDATRLDALLGLVECRLATGRYAEARALLAAEAEDGEGSARIALARARVAREVGEYAEAINYCRTGLQVDSRNPGTRLELCELLETVGQRDEALKEYEWFEQLVLRQLPIKADELTAVGQGFYRYSVLSRDPNLTQRTRHVLTQIFQVACERIDRTYWPARIAAADLLREKFNVHEAREDYIAALEINTNAVEAHVGLGRLALEDWDFEAIEGYVSAALAINSNSVAAFNLRCAGKLLERQYVEAAVAADRALAINPNDLEALGLMAAALTAQSRTEDAGAFVSRAALINPCSRVVHEVIAGTLSGLRRFPESEARYQQAIACEPTAAAPRTELGMMYMQWGDESKARDALETAWKLDPFNDRTKNTLDLLDRLDRFAQISTERYVVRYDPERDEVIARYFANYLETIYDEVCRDYDATLARPTVIEIFPSHTEFGVRIHGKPWIHTIGACTGWVIAVDAPRVGGDLPGAYNFAEVLRHEFTHTVTLAVTRNRIPHWFTEGLAVMQEQSDRPYGWTAQLADAVRRGELYTLDSIDWGFMRPRKPDGRQQAYAQSEWMCEYLTATHGYEVINRMLQLFADGKSQPDVIREITGAGPGQFDTQFAEWATAQVRSWGFDLTPPEVVDDLRRAAEEKPEDSAVLARLASAELDADDPEAALAAATRCLDIAADNSKAMEVLLRATARLLHKPMEPSARQAMEDEAAEVAERLLAADARNRHALAARSAVHMRRKEYELALPLLHRLIEVWPIDPYAAEALAEIYFTREDFAAAQPFVLAAARANTHDLQAAQRAGEVCERLGQLPDARFWYLRALHNDPLAEAPHLRLAEVAMRLNDLPAAVEEYRVLCRIAPHSAKYHADCALAYRKLGDVANMREFAERAVKLDPHSPAAALLHD